jgi:hypothetical protein
MMIDDDEEPWMAARRMRDAIDRPPTWGEYALAAFLGGSAVAGIVGGLVMRLVG